MPTMVKEKDEYIGTHVEEENILFPAVADCHIVPFQGVATTKTLE